MKLSDLYAKRLFAPVMDWSLSRPIINALRRQLVGEAAGKVLEIGFGSGLNLPFYCPEVTSLTLLDREFLLPRRVQQRLETCRARDVVRVKGTAERLAFHDETFDGVVSTFTLCSIADASAALSEVRRVLRPGGALLFLEHGRGAERSIARWQDRLNPLQRFVACGCNLNRPIDQLIEATGLSLLTLARPHLPAVPRVLGSLYVGTARKE